MCRNYLAYLYLLMGRLEMWKYTFYKKRSWSPNPILLHALSLTPSWERKRTKEVCGGLEVGSRARDQDRFFSFHMDSSTFPHILYFVMNTSWFDLGNRILIHKIHMLFEPYFYQVVWEQSCHFIIKSYVFDLNHVENRWIFAFSNCFMHEQP